MVNIREAQSGDTTSVVVMVEAMSDESPRYNQWPFNPVKTAILASYFCDEPNRGGFVAEQDGELVGMIAGSIADSLTHDYKFAADVGVYVKPEYRGTSVFLRLVKAWEEWAFANGADEVNLGISTELQADKTVHIYQRLGYKLSGHSMVKYKGH